MKRVQYLHYGGPEELRLDEVKQPDPKRRQIRVRVRAAAANPMDWKIRRGEMRALSGFQFPRGLGHDFAGVVEAVGPGVERLKVGDEVLGVTSIGQAGAFAESAVADEKNAALKPPSILFEQAAALTLVSVTAWTALVAKAKLRTGQSVFITGCLGGVGRAAVQIARMHGADVVGSCSASGREEALALGVGEVADYRAFDIALYRHRFDVVFDTAGALSLSKCGAMLKRRGMSLHIVPTAKAKAEAGYRFYALYDKISREDILAHAYAQCRSNKGAPGVDGQDFADIEAYGVQRRLGELALALRQETYRPDPSVHSRHASEP